MGTYRIAAWKLPPVLDAHHADEAVGELISYFSKRSASNARHPAYTGSMFERLGGGGDRPGVMDAFTAEDIVAVSMLSVDIPAEASLRILGPDAPHMSRLLQEIPADVDLVDADDDLIDPDSAAQQLYRLLHRFTGMGQVKVSKLLARKRPRLIPVMDQYVQQVVGHDGKAGYSYWHTLREHLRRDNRALHEALCDLRTRAHLGDDISAIRVFDVLVWKARRSAPGPVRLPQSTDVKEGGRSRLRTGLAANQLIYVSSTLVDIPDREDSHGLDVGACDPSSISTGRCTDVSAIGVHVVRSITESASSNAT